jgi:hypothetical protein
MSEQVSLYLCMLWLIDSSAVQAYTHIRADQGKARRSGENRYRAKGASVSTRESEKQQKQGPSKSTDPEKLIRESVL